MKSQILVVDDEPDIRDLVKDILEDEGYNVSVAENGETARQLFQRSVPDLVLLDIWMPDVDGISLLKEFKTDGNSAPVVMISGHGSVEMAVEATHLGAFDFIEKPLSLGKLLLTVQRALASVQNIKELPASRGDLTEHPREPVGRSVIMQNFREQVKRVAGYDAWVLISGESGSGKNLFARYLHDYSSRRDKPFITVRVAALEDNAEVLLFGRIKDGKIDSGYLEQADGGTLVIDDIAELDLTAQAKLLDVLITHSFKRIGAKDRNEINVRIVGVTRYDPQAAVQLGQLRDDLFYRINEIPLRVPTLREHCEDIPEMLNYFIDYFVARESLPYRRFSMAAQNWLRNYSWPGNVLELRNLVRRLLILGDETEVDVADVESAAKTYQSQAPVYESPEDLNLPLREARERFEKTYLEYHLRQTGGNVGLVAKQAGMERTHLYRKFRALGIDPKNIK
jgi:two-component system nitrogen regulation response regulator NtrX